MRKHKVVERPATTIEVLEYTVCDVCGRSSKPYRNWSGSAFMVGESYAKLRLGEAYPEGGSGTQWLVDLCPECFEFKFIPWIESFGHTTIEETEWDF
jgi:hypothetical protein